MVLPCCTWSNAVAGVFAPMARSDEDTAPLVPPLPGGTGSSPGGPGERRANGGGGEGAPAAPRVPWRVYEFATPEAAVLYVAYVQALGRLRGWWPELGVERERVRLDLEPVAMEAGSASARRSAAALHAAALDLGARPGTHPFRRGGGLDR